MASVSLFISYSSEDHVWLKKVVQSLSPLVHDGLARIWTDQNLSGLDHEGWEQNLLRNLNEAGYIVVLWSPSYSNSSYCRKELDLALERKGSGSAKVMLIHLRHCLLPRQMAEFQIRPSRDAAISASANTDEALWRIAAEIQRELTLAQPVAPAAPVTPPRQSPPQPVSQPQPQPVTPRRPIPRSRLYGGGGLLAAVILAVVLWRLPLGSFEKSPVEKSPVEKSPVEQAAPGDPSPKVPVAPTDSEKRKNSNDGLMYVSIAPGNFTMGCSQGDKECDADEKPAHKVTIAKGFRLGQTEVTQAAYQQVMKSNPSYFKGADLPVGQVTWDEARQYCAAVGGRLPTEAEWEYAARAGTAGSRYGDLDSVAWYFGNSGGKTHPVAKQKANAWGLYDMLGNGWEWTNDWYGEYQANAATDPKGPASGTERVLRGGSWVNAGWNSRVSYRFRFVPSGRSFDFGVRCAWDSP